MFTPSESEAEGDKNQRTTNIEDTFRFRFLFPSVWIDLNWEHVTGTDPGFPRGGVNPKEEEPTYYLAKIYRKCMKMKKIALGAQDFTM